MVNVSDVIASLQPYQGLDERWMEAYKGFKHKIIVLDDDPTGVQTVHHVPVFTDWSKATIEQIFQEERQLNFILTNSRAFSTTKTTEAHQQIAEHIRETAAQYQTPFLLISRGDSTLRGHYPLETEVLKETLEKNADTYDGEILIPFFKEGGRYTVQNTHYVKQNERFIPAGETEFAKDRMFGFKSSDLTEWVEEKTNGRFLAKDVTTISLSEMRNLEIEKMKDKLMAVEDFNKVVVNAVDEEDLKAFSIALLGAIESGKKFLFRTAASFTKVIGNIKSQPYLEKEDVVNESSFGGLVIVGSHVQKTTEQLNALKELSDVTFLEFDCHAVHNHNLFQEEIDRVQNALNASIQNGETVCIYTSRERIDLGENQQEEELALSVKISNAVTSFVQNCAATPRYVIAKGGITSSDVGTIGLAVQKAEVMGQIAPGIPVWKTDEHSRFPHIPYIIFPGNVGEKDTLKNIVKKLQ